MRGKSASRFVYKERSVDDMKARASGDSQFDSWTKQNCPMFTPKAGKHRLRILPPTWEDARHYGYDVYLNYGIGPDNQTYLSLSRMLGEEDPVKEEHDRAANAGNEDDAKALKANKRILCYVIDRKNEDAGPLLWAMPVTIDRDLVALSIDETTGEILAIDHPTDGYDISFTKEGEKLRTTYTGIQIARAPSPLSPDQDVADSWLDYVLAHPVPECLNFYGYDHIKAVLRGASAIEARNMKEPKAARPAVTEDAEPRSVKRPALATNGAGKDRPRVVKDEVVEEKEEEAVEPEQEEVAPARPSLGDRLRQRQVARR